MMKTLRLLILFYLRGVSHAFLLHPLIRSKGQGRSPDSARGVGAGGSIIVVSPPGGIGEVAAVKAACLGSKVRWFIVSKDVESSVVLAPQALQEVLKASGSLEIARGNAVELKEGGDALTAVSKWCSSADGIVCCYDGCNSDDDWKAAVVLATSEAAKNVKGPRVATLAVDDDLEAGDFNQSSEKGLVGLVGLLFNPGKKMPTTLVEALGGNPSVIRHGELFGIPEWSPDFSPLVGGPRREPVLTEEYTMRDIRIDPFMVSGNIMASSSRKACRHAVGELAGLLATGILEPISSDVSVSSQPGPEAWSFEQWEEEFERVRQLVTSGKASTLFSQEMLVDDTERLADWLATKWAPAVMRTYDIAAIRIGARPVFANRVDDSRVEIVWQELVNFETTVVGKMLLEVTREGLVATRQAGDVSKGYGSISKNPLPGEEVLVRRLADAVAQSIEKGLAKKVFSKKSTKTGPLVPIPTSSLQSSGTVDRPSSFTGSGDTATGPRQSGARRSTPRSRKGSRGIE